MKTYNDFERVIRDYPWVENGLVVTYVRDADPTTVIAAMTDEFLGKAIGLSGVNERGWEELSIVGAAQLGPGRLRLRPCPWWVSPKS